MSVARVAVGTVELHLPDVANEVISKAMDYIEDNVDGWVTDIQVEIL